MKIDGPEPIDIGLHDADVPMALHQTRLRPRDPLANILQGVGGLHGGYDYRETISPWFRSIFMLRPRAELMADVPLAFKLHIVAGLLLFAIWPFTRLVHAVSPPVGYVTRPYIVYHSRGGAISTVAPRRGWDPVRTQGTGNQGADDLTPSQGA